MRRHLIAGLLLAMAAAPLQAQLVSQVRSAINAGDFARGEALIAGYRAQRGATPEMILALSWLGRGALAAKNYESAARYAEETRELALKSLQSRELDAEPDLPLALGASFEVTAHSLAATGRRSEAVAFLNEQIRTYWNTSIRTRTQKNINLLSLEGEPAIPVQASEFVGKRPAGLAQFKGRPVILFLWAHWCSDCKAQGPVLEQILSRYSGRKLALLGVTQRYGYAAGGEDATPAEELRYIESIRQRFYDRVLPGSFVSEETFRKYGASTTPTLVLVDAQGIVRMYHPGKMTAEELSAAIDRLPGGRVPATD